jgi:hypothetical protein
VQNLVWGGDAARSPGMIADRFGTAKSCWPARLLYVVGLVAMAHATTPLALVLTCGVLIGVGTLGRHVQRHLRRARSRVSTRAAEHGARHLRCRRVLRPVRDGAGTQWLLTHLGWYGALLGLGGIALLMCRLPSRWWRSGSSPSIRFASPPARRCAKRCPIAGYMLLTIGFFVCGFPGRFRRRPLAAYLADKGMPPHVAVTALA